jgi:hypothetical protein
MRYGVLVVDRRYLLHVAHSINRRWGVGEEWKERTRMMVAGEGFFM